MSEIDAFDAIYLSGYAIFVAIRGAYDRGAREPVDALEAVLMAVVAAGVMIVPLLHLFTPLFDGFDFTPLVWPRVVGATILLLSLILFWLAHVQLGANFSRTIEIQSEQKLVTHGLYRLVRHPIYAAIWLFVIAQALLLANWIATFSGIVSFAAMYFVRVPREERMMRERFGTEYEDYLRRTPRVIPRLSARERIA